MSPNPESFLAHLREAGYHPRSDKHSNSLAESIAIDLVANCPHIRDKASNGHLVYDLNFSLRAGTAEWNVDLVFGPPALGVVDTGESGNILRRRPSTIEIAIEIKSVMTEHRKAVKNRKRDLEAHHEHVHNYDAEAIAAGVLVINASSSFQSPLRSGLTIHKDPTRLVEHCLNELRSVSSRGGPTGYGLEARCAIVVNLDNLNRSDALYVTKPPAPPQGDPLHYDSFIRTICTHYTRRF